MQLTRESAEQRLHDFNMGDMPVMELRPSPTVVTSDWFTKYKKLCHEFTQSLTDSVDELALMNLTTDEFMGLIMGNSVPQNLSIRFRVPLTWGGKLELDNLFMCNTFPNSQRLDEFIIAQSDAQTVWLPNPSRKIYVPGHNIAGADGGNATSDRLSQIAAQIVAARSMGQ